MCLRQVVKQCRRLSTVTVTHDRLIIYNVLTFIKRVYDGPVVVTESGCDFRQGKEIYAFYIASRPAVRPSKAPVQKYDGSFPR